MSALPYSAPKLNTDRVESNEGYTKPQVSCVVPTCRPESYSKFLQAWEAQFKQHNVHLVTVTDGIKPEVTYHNKSYSLKKIMGKYSDVIYNKNDGVRNLGFAFVAKYLPQIDVCITLDDDTRPLGDTIGDHLSILGKKVPITWMSTASEFMRGFPYGIREEAEVMVSHGVWQGVADWDAPTQLIYGNRPVTFYKGIIPKGVLSPMCIMNVAFKREMLPFIYQAPMGYKIGLDRFGDIWGGIELKKDMDKLGYAYATGYATVRHERASNVWTNLIKEAKGLPMNEEYGKDDYFKLFAKKRARWQQYIAECKE